VGLAAVVVAYGCCVGSWEKFNANIRPRTLEKPLLGLDRQTSIAEAYNTILDAYLGWPIDALVLLHDDLEITDPNAEAKFLEALALPDVALVGVAGGHGIGSLAWWNANTVGHQMIDSGLLDLGPRTGYVDLLEGSILVFGSWAIEHLRFDTRFEGFHGYDDIAMIAHSYGKRVYVADVDTHHHVQLGFKSETSAQAWAVADRQFREKWGL
jgi:hypothetical protein